MTNSDIHNSRSVVRVFSFWANLMTTADLMTTSDVVDSEYPSQTSVLAMREARQGWDTLEGTRGLHPPDVELLD